MANISRLDIPTTGFWMTKDNPLIVARPTRKLVNDPGPNPTAIPSSLDMATPDAARMELMPGMIEEI